MLAGVLVGGTLLSRIFLPRAVAGVVSVESTGVLAAFTTAGILNHVFDVSISYLHSLVKSVFVSVILIPRDCNSLLLANLSCGILTSIIFAGFPLCKCNSLHGLTSTQFEEA